MPEESGVIRRNLEEVRYRISAAAERVGRDPASIRLIAVSKGYDAQAIRTAYAAGVRHFGENRVQEMESKATRLSDLATPITWHMIGRLQSNKVKALLSFCRVIHSVDRHSLATEISRRASGGEDASLAQVLVEVNVAGEAAKGGLAPSELLDFLDWCAQLPGIQVMGLMTMAPLSADPGTSRSVFRVLRQLRDRANARGMPGPRLQELSMGMSQDFEVAVEEGATILRVGSAIFSPRR